MEFVELEHFVFDPDLHDLAQFPVYDAVHQGFPVCQLVDRRLELPLIAHDVA